ncbi:MAG: 50S ribosomal protein L17, partial [Candidatus Omnitrophota bacterium]
MRHRKRRTKFGRQSSHRKATLKSLAISVFLHQRIKTTHTKAKEARRVVESLITMAKTNSIAARRNVFSVLGDETLVKKLFTEIAPLFSKRKGGYTRIIPYNFRKGDGASMV